MFIDIRFRRMAMAKAGLRWLGIIARLHLLPIALLQMLVRFIICHVVIMEMKAGPYGEGPRWQRVRFKPEEICLE